VTATIVGRTNVPVEFPAASNEITFHDPEGRERRVPAFWSGGERRVRYASPLAGDHRFGGGVVRLRPYEGENPSFLHGPLLVHADGRRLEHADGTPFLWLADTWWLAFVERFGWPDDVRRLTADRLAKGFNAVHVVAGLYPEMPPFDGRGDGAAGWPWTEGFRELNAAWWDEADLRLGWIVRSGLVPLVVGAWGYHLLFGGVEAMTRHWREVIARWGAYPVVWCLAGECKLPYYPDIFGERREEISEQLREGWAEVARFVRETDPYGRLLTVHPSPGDGSFSSRDVFDDPELFDVVALQTGHWDKQSLPGTLEVLHRELAREPRKPVFNSEVCYEGILGSNAADTQRFLVWSHLLSGAAGHSYGAQGLWGMNDGTFVGEAGAWAELTWEEAARQPGGAQVGIARRALERYRWWEFEPHHASVEPHCTPDDRLLPYAAGIADEVRVVYFPGGAMLRDFLALKEIVLHDLHGEWRAHWLNPRTGVDHEAWTPEADASGNARIDGGFITSTPSMEDWVLILEREGAQ
jgi:hypothetical protein